MRIIRGTREGGFVRTPLEKLKKFPNICLGPPPPLNTIIMIPWTPLPFLKKKFWIRA